MQNEEDNKKALNTFNIGTDSDTTPELIQEGYYIDASNMEDTNAVSGTGKGLSKIGGELPLYIQNTAYCPNEGLPVSSQIIIPIPDPNGWECIGVGNVNDHVIEFWVYNGFNPLATGSTIIRIDGIVMCTDLGNSSLNMIGLQPSFPLQLDTNDSCVGGEIFITDFNIHPYIFNIQDIISNYYSNPATGAYFSNFNPNMYSVTLQETNDHPVFVELVQTANGLPAGDYSYSIQLVDSTGNATNWSVQTPYIPVARKVGGITTYGNRTYGGAENDPLGNTTYGIHIRFRVNNIANYSYVSIRRVCQNTAQALNYTPSAQSTKFAVDYNLGTLPSTYLTDNPNYVWNFLDNSGVQWTDISDTQDTTTQSAFQTCKAIRYYDETLVLMNIKYPSKNVSGINSNVFIEKNNQLGFPVMENMGTAGHSDIYNQVYFKNNQSGEEEGYGIEFIDATNNKSFVLPYENGVQPSLNDFTMPDRRTPLTEYADSFDYSYGKWKGAVLAPDTNRSVSRTFERFDLGDLNSLGSGKWNSQAVSIQDGQYEPLTPVKEDDSTLTGLAFQVNQQVAITTSMGRPVGTIATYNEAGFDPRYFSQGMAFNGLKNIPSWATSFSIVKRPKAQRIVCQGIGVYDFDPNNPANNNIGSETGARRFKNTVRFFTPDFMPTALFNPKIQDFINNPSNYYAELVSPLGFFSELYNSKIPDSIGVGYTNRNDPNADLISYARLIYNSASINTGLEDSTGTQDFYTKFGTWRNSSNSSDPSVHAPTTLYPIDSGTNMTASGDPSIGKQPYMQLNLGSAALIYWNHFISQVRVDVNDGTVQDFHEPFYIINIVDKSAAFTTSNADNYEETGHLQKLESLIGKCTSAAQRLILVDERWEDCIPNPFVNGVATGSSNDKRYCYVDNPNTGQAQPWINITYLNPATIVSDLISNGYSDVPDVDLNGNPIVVRVYGVYQNDNINFTSRQFNLIFEPNNSLPIQCCVPQGAVSGNPSYIRVRYDNRIPIKLFAGDSFIGETVFQPIQSSGGYAFINPLPYLMYNTPSNYQIIKRIDKEPISGYRFAVIQGDTWLQLGTIRQWVVMFCCESMVNVPLCHSLDSVWGGNTSGIGTGNTYNGDKQSFPLVHYVMRPNNPLSNTRDNFGDYTISAATYAFWVATGIWLAYIAPFILVGGGDISHPLYQHLVDYQYDKDYPDECQSGRWNYGGFKVNQQYNIDYSKFLNDNSNTSTPIVGFKEVTWFCSRIIWSMPRAINVQDDPNLKTFPVLNVYDISDKTQEIKYAFDDMSAKGGNLFAITGKGICLLFTNKTLISDTTLNQLALINPTDGWIQGEYWLSKTIGCNDEMWRGIAEYINECFIPNNESVYRLSGTQIVDIGRAGKDTSKSIIAGSEGECRGSYYSRLYSALQTIESSYNTPICAVYNVKDKTYWLKIGINKFTFAIPIVPGTNLSLLNLYTLILHGVNIVSGSFINLYSTVYGATVVLPTLDIPLGGTLTLRNIGSYNILVQGDDLNLVHLNVGETIVFTRDSSPYGWNENTPFDVNSEAKVFVFSENPNKLAWQGKYDYNFDKMLCVRKYSNPPNNTLINDTPTMINDIRVFGMRNLTTFRLKDFTSNLINGINVNGFVIISVAPQKGLTAELIDILTHSDQIPIRVEFSETESGLPECKLDSSISTFYLRNYRGSWYNQCPRKEAIPPSTSRFRLQNTQFFIKIIHNAQGQFIIRDVITGYKLLV